MLLAFIETNDELIDWDHKYDKQEKD